MPYVIGSLISEKDAGFWGEGAPYKKDIIYNIHSTSDRSPPVHYESHTLKPHSICHVDAPGHIVQDGKKIDDYFTQGLIHFFGPAWVIQATDLPWQSVNSPQGEMFVRLISVGWLEAKLDALGADLARLERLIVGAPDAPLLGEQQDPSFIQVFSPEATEKLAQLPNFKLFGTSSKSTDFQPTSRQRPCHTLLFEHNIAIVECLKLSGVPEGEYWFFGVPLPLTGATESPICPVLFTKEEMAAFVHF